METNYQNKKYTGFNIGIKKDNVIIGKNYYLLIRVGNYKLGIKDKYVYTNQYINHVELGIANEMDYTMFKDNNENGIRNGDTIQMKGSELLELLKPMNIKSNSKKQPGVM